jgi:hypothetical protein
LKACDDVKAKVAWLVIESDGETYPVYRVARIDAVPLVLAECPFLEYYLIDHDYGWLIADTDHNELLVATR